LAVVAGMKKRKTAVEHKTNKTLPMISRKYRDFDNVCALRDCLFLII